MGKYASPMQKSVAATSIPIFILSLYPVLAIASLTISNPSITLPTEIGENQIKFHPGSKDNIR